MMNSKPMIYKNNCRDEQIAGDVYKGYEYVVINRGTHPCCYIRIPHGCRRIDLDVHGGVTYHERFLAINGECIRCPKSWWIGWDYAHAGDYMGYYEGNHGKKWTTEELEDHCRSAIDQIIISEGERGGEDDNG